MGVIRNLFSQSRYKFQRIRNGIAGNTQSHQTNIVCSHSDSTRRRGTTVTHAFSLSGSGDGDEYTSAGELADAGRNKRKKKRIAGIDQVEPLDPKLLADPDSFFYELQGVEIHHKLYDPNAQDQTQAPSMELVGLPMILLHGFGASVFSWNKATKRLSDLTASKVLAFDRPAFGLTSRLDAFATRTGDAKPLNPYSMAFSVLATLHFIGLLDAKKAILVGHSAGALVAIDAYLEAPDRVAALILVAPAIFAPRAIPKLKVVEAKGNGSDSLRKPQFELFESLFKLIKYITQAIIQVIKGIADVIVSLYKKALVSFLRSAFGVMLVRMMINRFGVACVRYAWYDSKQVDEHIVEGYTKPLRTKGWDKALVEFTAAMLTNDESETKQPMAKRLHEISCPVLIITGDTDRIVPSWICKRVSRAIPHSTLEVIKNCGHLPHEEKVDEFVGVIQKFLQRAFGGLEEHSLRAPA